MSKQGNVGMTPAAARKVEYTIIGLGVLALVPALLTRKATVGLAGSWSAALGTGATATVSARAGKTGANAAAVNAVEIIRQALK